MLRQIDTLYAQAQALESASEVATVLAVRAGASSGKVAQVLEEAVSSAPKPPGSDRLEQARCHLEGRRCICRAVTRLALDYGVDPELLLSQLTEAGEGAARLRLAVTPSDLGL